MVGAAFVATHHLHLLSHGLLPCDEVQVIGGGRGGVGGVMNASYCALEVALGSWLKAVGMFRELQLPCLPKLSDLLVDGGGQVVHQGRHSTPLPCHHHQMPCEDRKRFQLAVCAVVNEHRGMGGLRNGRNKQLSIAAGRIRDQCEHLRAPRLDPVHLPPRHLGSQGGPHSSGVGGGQDGGGGGGCGGRQQVQHPVVVRPPQAQPLAGLRLVVHQQPPAQPAGPHGVAPQQSAAAAAPLCADGEEGGVVCRPGDGLPRGVSDGTPQLLLAGGGRRRHVLDVQAVALAACQVHSVRQQVAIGRQRHLSDGHVFCS
mmetsp:Transcript_7208/g.21240  ORF Transcript_7208/g.21240 Transcript_7208/m.21240 type:complete len:313 (-) Transcript_7208:210-1148(-)